MEYESAVAKVEIYERSLRDISLCVDDKSLARRIEEVLGVIIPSPIWCTVVLDDI